MYILKWWVRLTFDNVQAMGISASVRGQSPLRASACFWQKLASMLPCHPPYRCLNLVPSTLFILQSPVYSVFLPSQVRFIRLLLLGSWFLEFSREIHASGAGRFRDIGTWQKGLTPLHESRNFATIFWAPRNPKPWISWNARTVDIMN